jgi:hypothetical protein
MRTQFPHRGGEARTTKAGRQPGRIVVDTRDEGRVMWKDQSRAHYGGWQTVMASMWDLAAGFLQRS